LGSHQKGEREIEREIGREREREREKEREIERGHPPIPPIPSIHPISSFVFFYISFLLPSPISNLPTTR